MNRPIDPKLTRRAREHRAKHEARDLRDFAASLDSLRTALGMREMPRVVLPKVKMDRDAT